MAVVSCTWHKSKSTGNIPCPRTGHALITADETVYLFGGSQTSGERKPEFFNDLFQATVLGDEFRWERVEVDGQLPPPRDKHAMCFVDNYLYVFGGRNEFTVEKCFTEVFRYSTADERCWKQIVTAGPSPRAIGFSANAVKRRVFAFGGTSNGNSVQDMFMFNLDINEWTPIHCGGTVPTARCNHACDVVGDKIYLFGGMEKANKFSRDIYTFETTSFLWKRLQCKGVPPSGRESHSFVAHRDKDIYVYGGRGSSSMNSSASIILKFSIGSKKWKQPLCAGEVPPAISIREHCAIVLHSNMYIVGGVGEDGVVDMDQIYFLRFINPSFRKPVIEYMLNEFCKQSNSLSCWLPTQKPTVNYNIGKKEEKLENHTEKFLSSSINDKLPLTTQLIESEFHEAEALEAQESLFKVAREELAHAKQSFENDRKEMIRLLERQRADLLQVMESHRKQNELWWNSRIKENDEEKEKLRLAWNELETERIRLNGEREKLQNKASQVAHILKQLSSPEERNEVF